MLEAKKKSSFALPEDSIEKLRNFLEMCPRGCMSNLYLLM